MGRSVGKSLKGEQHFRDVVSIAEQENVVAVRNEKRGHGWMAANEEAYRGEADNLEVVLDKIEHELRPFLEKYPSSSTPVSVTGGQWVIEGEHLVGSHILHPTFKLTLDSDPRLVGLQQENQVYITDAKMEQFKMISPFIRHEISPRLQTSSRANHGWRNAVYRRFHGAPSESPNDLKL